MDYNTTKTFSLELISGYGDDEEESESELKEEFEDQSEASPLNSSLKLDTKQSPLRLPLPSSIVQLFKEKPAVNSTPEDNPSLHDGRIRSFPHERGNWSTYIYIPYEPEEGFRELLARLTLCAANAGVKLKTAPDFHISLTRTVVLLHHWIDHFISSIRLKLCHIPRFCVQLGAPAVYCNEERTRTFLGLCALTSCTQLREIVRNLDECLAEFRLLPFYKDPSFHMSILWVVGDAQKELDAILPQLRMEFEAHLLEYPHELNIYATQCHCKTGNKSFSFPLANC